MRAISDRRIACAHTGCREDVCCCHCRVPPPSLRPQLHSVPPQPLWLGFRSSITTHTSTIALRYDQLMRARLAQQVANGTHTSDKLSVVDAALVGELLNEQLSNFNRKQLGSGSSSSDALPGSKKRQREWYGAMKPDLRKSKGKGKGKGKKCGASSPPP